MSLSLRFAAGSHKGMIREGNEDSGYAGPQLLAVADGMGGAAAGEVASSEVLSTIVDLDEDVPGADLLDELRHAVDRANDRLRVMIDDDPQLEGMGTTLTAMLWTHGKLGLVHIGDSRAYRLRDEVLEQITQDHTWVQRLVDSGQITAEEADHHPQRSLLMKALDGRGQVEPDVSLREARVGDRYLICSDGLSGPVSQDTMQETLLTYLDPAQAVQELIQLALRGGGPDNITCIVADVIESGGPLQDVPMVVGAVADDHRDVLHHDATTLPTTPASRARELTKGDYSEFDDGADYEPEQLVEGGGTRRRKPKPVWRRTAPWVVAGAVVAAGLGGAYWWTQQQYYVANQGDHVAIYRGINTNLLGLELSSPYKKYPDVTLSLIGAGNRKVARDTSNSGSLAEARTVISTMQTQARVCQKVIDYNTRLGQQPPVTGAPTAAPATPAAFRPADSQRLLLPKAPDPTSTAGTGTAGNGNRLGEGSSRTTPKQTSTRPSTDPSSSGAPSSGPPAAAGAPTPTPQTTAPEPQIDVSPDEMKLIDQCDTQLVR